MLGFVAVALTILGLIHLYLYKRLVHDTTRPGRWRRLGAAAAAGLALLFPLTMYAGDGRPWLAWPGYVWIAVMFYLLVVLAAMELPMLATRIWLRRRERRAAPARAAPEPALVGTALEPAHAQASAGSTAPVPVRPGPRSAGSEATEATREGRTPRAPEPARAQASAGRHSRRLVLARGAAVAAGLAAAGITGYGVSEALGPPAIRRLRIPLARLSPAADGLRIAVVADVHIGPLTGSGHTRRIVRLVNDLDADLIAVVGDLTSSGVDEVGTATEPLADLRSRYGTFFVTGNHEYYTGHREWMAEAEALGMRVLRNERLEIVHRGGAIDLAGVNDVTGAEFGEPPDFAKALGDRDPARPVVLLAHQPVQARQAARFGVDLQLSGHTHGGQMVPFNLLVGLQQPIVSGLGTIDGTTVYVTNGAGFWGPPARVGAPPEIALVELRST